jgi:Sucrase/ferredoxin-like
VWTNGSRDRCCAAKGRDLAAQLHYDIDGAGSDEASVVEISHLGGHRFAPTMLVLPWGYAYGRLDLDTAANIAYAAQDGLVHPSQLRGRADLAPAAQVADAIWRTELGPAPIDAVEIRDTQRDGHYSVVTANVRGRREELRLQQVPGETIVATACGGRPIATAGWHVS